MPVNSAIITPINAIQAMKEYQYNLKAGELRTEAEQATRKITFIAGGGTIGSIVKEGGIRYAGGGSIDLISKLAVHHPEVTSDLEVQYTLDAFGGLSENMTPEIQSDFLKLAKVAISSLGAKSIVVTHGTDSLEHTAKFLYEQLQSTCIEKGVKIVMTGANHDTSHPQTDAWDNLTLAIKTSTDIMTPSGVYVAFHDQIIPGNTAVKEPFNDVSMNYRDKYSAEYANLALAQELNDQRMIGKIERHFKSPTKSDYVTTEKVNRVGLSLNPDKYKGKRVVVFQLYHSGTAITEGDSSVAKLIAELGNRNTICLAVTENGEPVNLMGYETGVKLKEAGLIAMPGSMTLATASALAGAIVNGFRSRPISVKEMIDKIESAPDEILGR